MHIHSIFNKFSYVYLKIFINMHSVEKLLKAVLPHLASKFPADLPIDM